MKSYLLMLAELLQKAGKCEWFEMIRILYFIQNLVLYFET